MMQAPGELLLTDGEGMGVRAALDLIAQRGAERDQGLERGLPRLRELGSSDPVRARPKTPTISAISSPPPPSMPMAVSTKTDGGSSMVSRAHRRGKPGRRSAGPAPREPALARSGSLPGQDRIETLKRWASQKPGLLDVGLFVLQPEDGGAHLTQQGGRSISSGSSSGSSPSARTAERTKRGEVLPRGLRVEAAEPGIQATSPAALAAAGSKWYLRSR